MSDKLDRLEAGREVVRAKEAEGVSWQELADALGHSLVWTTSALLGQQPLSADQAEKVGALLRLDDETVESLSLPPVRGEQAMDPTEPVTYRLQEALQVYGTALHELIREEYGDGIMSAIDFTLDVQRQEDPKGDRVVVTMNGKFLPYKKW